MQIQKLSTKNQQSNAHLSSKFIKHEKASHMLQTNILHNTKQQVISFCTAEKKTGARTAFTQQQSFFRQK